MHKLTNIEILNFSFNKILKIQNLYYNVLIKSLDLSYNKISEIRNISHLTLLDTINLEYNPINLDTQDKENLPNAINTYLFFQRYNDTSDDN